MTKCRYCTILALCMISARNATKSTENAFINDIQQALPSFWVFIFQECQSCESEVLVWVFPNHSCQNNCSVGPETSIPEIEKLKAQLPFLREDFSVPRLDSQDRGKEKFSQGKGRGRELFYWGYICFMPYRYIFSTSQTSWPQPKVYEIMILVIWKPWGYSLRSKITQSWD